MSKSLLFKIFTYVSFASLTMINKNAKPRSWVSCPFGINILVSLLKGNKINTEKYNQMSQQLQKKVDCSFQSKLFSKTSKIGGIEISGQESYEKPVPAFSQWVKSKSFKKLNLMPEDSEFIIANISTFKGSWKQSTDGALMKIYNSFNYTQDVKYEARLLELRMKEDLKFIIIVPNECDVLLNLFQTLNDEGLNAAVRKIGPIFVASSELKAPKIVVESATDMRINEHVAMPYLLNEVGNVIVDEHGVRMKVLTCVYPAQNQIFPEKPQNGNYSNPFYFGVVNDDILIFSGSFWPKF